MKRTLALGALLLCACGPRLRKDDALSPAESLRTIRVAPGFEVRLVAAEPDVQDPVAIDFDEDGRIFVVEMPGYPMDTSASGRVRLLEDTNGDGKPDKSRVFADGLVMPTGVMRWKNGVIVTAAPDVLYLADEDGDGRAEKREVLLTGFAFSNPQHTVNGPLYGLDNWIHLAHEGPARAVVYQKEFGDMGGPLRFPARPDQAPVAPLDSAIRFKPDTFEAEPRSGNTQFGHSFDEWGRYFTLDNSEHGRHEVIAARYLKRNPDLLLRDTQQHVSDHGDAAKVFPANPNPRVEMLTEYGEMTSACSFTVYLGGLFPKTVFVAEPVHNLVHSDVLKDAGATFAMSRALPEGREFLAASDGWFRPVNFTIGPDGALYVVDYYRKSIEHPEWTSAPPAGHTHDHGAGGPKGRGRIHRVAPTGAATLAAPRLGKASGEQLVAHLSHANVWWRRTAQRLLVARRDAAVVPQLERLAREGPSPLGRLHALWTLAGLGRLGPESLEAALRAPEPGLRENAIRLADEHGLLQQLAAPLRSLADDPDPKVRFQLLLALGSASWPDARAVRTKLLLSAADDAWMQAAALTGPSQEAVAWFETRGLPPAFRRRAAAVVAARAQRSEVARVLAVADAAALEGLADGVRARRASAQAFEGSADALLKLAAGSAEQRRAAHALIDVARLPLPTGALQRAAAVAADASKDAAEREDAVFLLGLSATPLLGLLDTLLDPKEPEAVSRAAARALGRVKGEEVGRLLIARWRSMTPAVRSEAADALQADPARFPMLMSALERKEVQGWTLNFNQKRRLLMNRDEKLRERARVLLDAGPADRAKVLEAYQPALRMQGDAARGERLFRSICARCHSRDGQGGNVAGDLGTVRSRPASVLLVDVIDPSRAIAQNYESWVVETKSGESHEGVLAGQTATSLTLRREGAPDVTIARADVLRMTAANLSAMPADLESQIGVAQMADLLRYLTAR
jgi:putative membrane-bound dehydrogenase-like protein